MAKNTFDDNMVNQEPVTNQFFIIQDDGTILSMNKEVPQVQYVTQLQDVKGSMENGNDTGGCASFDASSQQYYIDVHNSAPELISINDQFVIPNVENNVYANSYLLQAEPSTASQQEETKHIDPVNLHVQQLQSSNIDTLNGLKQENDLTEITLSDEQYQTLEQKGWILLEYSDKIFVLNTLGLHDITNDDKLIQKLKMELQESDVEFKLSTENVNSVFSSELEQKNSVCNNKADVIERSGEQTVNMQFINETDVEMNDQDQPRELKDDHFEKPVQPSSISNEIVETNGNTDKPNCDSIKIKTKYTFTDIPDKIFLGKTVNGKKLYAKVTKIKNNNKNKPQITTKNSKEISNGTINNVLYGKQIDVKPQYNSGLDLARFVNVIQDSFRTATQASPQSVASATSYISQLLRMPNMEDSIVGTNLILTKIVASKTEYGNDIGQPTMVTGTVEMQNGKGCFVHIPDMLQKLLDESDEKLKPITDDLLATKIAKDMIDLFHIHVSETRFADDKSPQISINLSKRKLPLDVLNDAKKRHPNPLYACGACGLTFKSESLIMDHQNNQCLEAEDELTIDTDEVSNNGTETFYSVTEIGKEKWYSCNICEAKFSRLFNCLKHITTHKTNVEKKVNVYKCKMCPSTYFHSSSLSKHIVKMHLQIQTK